MSFEVDNKLRETIDAALNDATSNDAKVAATAQMAIAAAITTPVRQAVLSGNVIGDIFNIETYDYGYSPEYPTDLIRPGTEAEFYAYTMPDHGNIPRKMVSSDRILVSTYRIANSIDTTRSYLRRAKWNVLSRMMQVLEAGFVKKLNDDGFKTIISAGDSRNILAYDSDATAGQFTPRLIALMKTIMRRNGGGNSTSINRGQLTHLFVSPEAKDDMRSWSLALVPDAVRTNIFYSSDNGAEFMKLFDVNIVDLDEIGVGQEYQLYFTGTLARSLASSDQELVIGVDKSQNLGGSFVMPQTKSLEIFTDDSVEAQRKGIFGMWGDMEVGFGCLDSRSVLLGSF